MVNSVKFFQSFHIVSDCRFSLPTAACQCCYGNNSEVHRVNSMLSSYLIIARSILFRATPLVKSPSERGVGSDSCLPQTHDLWGGVRSLPFPYSFRPCQPKHCGGEDGAFHFISLILGTLLLEQFWSIQYFYCLVFNSISTYLSRWDVEMWCYGNANTKKSPANEICCVLRAGLPHNVLGEYRST